MLGCISDKTDKNYSQDFLNNPHELFEDLEVDDVFDDVDIIVVKPNVYSSKKSKEFTKNNCGVGFQGTTSQFSVTVTSIISQIDADAKATALLEAQGQTYINSIGTCNCNLVWIEPSIEYKNDKAYVTIIILGAVEYGLNDNYQDTNLFIIDIDGEYKLSARVGRCNISGIITIKLGVDYDLYELVVDEINCELNYPDDGSITEIGVLDKGCENILDDIEQIVIIQSGCDVNAIAEIDDLKILNAC